MEDYEALLRSEKFNIPTVDIIVRNEVQVSAYATDVNDSFTSSARSLAHVL